MLQFLLIVTLLFSNPNNSKQISAVQGFSPSEESCMAVNVYLESSGESIKGMKAIAAVTYNRSESKYYKDSICNVVFSRKQFSWTHQKPYGFILKLLKGDTSELNSKDLKSYKLAVEIAKLPRSELTSVLPKNVLHYHSVFVKPGWAQKLQKFTVIGNHVFYISA